MLKVHVVPGNLVSFKEGWIADSTMKIIRSRQSMDYWYPDGGYDYIKKAICILIACESQQDNSSIVCYAIMNSGHVGWVSITDEFVI